MLVNRTDGSFTIALRKAVNRRAFELAPRDHRLWQVIVKQFWERIIAGELDAESLGDATYVEETKP